MHQVLLATQFSPRVDAVSVSVLELSLPAVRAPDAKIHHHPRPLVHRVHQLLVPLHFSFLPHQLWFLSETVLPVESTSADVQGGEGGTSETVLVPSRYSVVFFTGPRDDTVITPLPTCVTPTNPSRFSDITAGAHLQMKLQRTNVAQQ